MSLSEHDPNKSLYAPPQAELAEQASPPDMAEFGDLVAQKAGPLLATGHNGASWFYWIAGLSLVNVAILHGGGNTFFVIGLGITLFIKGISDAIILEVPNAAATVQAISLTLNVLVALAAAGCGWLSNKRYLVVFALGMFLYLCDGLLFVLTQDWMCVGFHAFALFGMWGGFSAFRQLSQFEQTLEQSGVEVRFE